MTRTPIDKKQFFQFAQYLFLRNGDFVVFVDDSNMEDLLSERYKKLQIYEILPIDKNVDRLNKDDIILKSNYQWKFNFFLKLIDSQTCDSYEHCFHPVKYGDILSINFTYRLNETFVVGLDSSFRYLEKECAITNEFVLYHAGNFDLQDHGKLFIPINITSKIENAYVYYSRIEYDYLEISTDKFIKYLELNFISLFNTLSKRNKNDIEKSELLCLSKTCLFYNSKLKLSKKDIKVSNEIRFFPFSNTFNYNKFLRLL